VQFFSYNEHRGHRGLKENNKFLIILTPCDHSQREKARIHSTKIRSVAQLVYPFFLLSLSRLLSLSLSLSLYLYLSLSLSLATCRSVRKLGTSLDMLINSTIISR